MKKTKKLFAVLLAAALSCCSLIFPAGAEEKLTGTVSYGSSYTYLSLVPSDKDNIITYTTNGAAPEFDSKVYTAKLRTKTKVLVRAAEFDKNGNRLYGVKMLLQLKCAGVGYSAKKSGSGYKVTLSSDTEGCTVYYTTDGSKPTKNSKVYKKPFTAEKGAVIRAFAAMKDCIDGDITSYTVSDKAAVSPVSVSAEKEEERVLKLINEYREKNGLSPLSIDSRLNKAAKIRALELLERYEHTRPNDTACFTVLYDVDLAFFSAAENIGWGEGDKGTPDSIVKTWIASEGHRANIATPAFDVTGISAVSDGKRVYWVQLFAKKMP